MTTASIYDGFLLDMTSRIVRNGFTMASVGMGDCSIPGCTCTADDDEEPYAYSVGMAEHGLAEVVVLGLAGHFCVDLASDVFAAVLRGESLDDGEARWFDGIPYMLRTVPAEWLAHDPSRIGLWLGYYQAGREELSMPEIRQIVWGDAQGRFPGDPLCDPFVAECQVLLADDPFSFPRRVEMPVRRRVRSSTIARHARRRAA